MNINVLELTLEEAQAILTDERLILASREEVLQGQSAIAERDALRAQLAEATERIETYKRDRAGWRVELDSSTAACEELRARAEKAEHLLEVSEDYRRAYQDGKYKMYASDDEDVREAAAKYLPCNEGPLERAVDAVSGSAQLKRLNCALAARVAELEEALAVPPELLTHMLKLGEVEWGSVPARSDEEHISDFRDTLQITRETFGTVGTVPLDGVYLQGTATVVCHTGTSPNSPMTARIVAGLWNHFLRTQSALSRTPAQSLAACKAAALREVAKEMQEVTDSIVWCEAELQGRQAIIDRVSEMAERLEAEAANG